MGEDSTRITPSNDSNLERFRAMLQEYQFLYTDLQSLSQARQSANQFLIGSIDVVLLTGVAYAWLQFAQGKLELLYLVGGTMFIALFASGLNNAMLRLSEGQRKIIALRVRYLESLERQMRVSGYFSDTMVRLHSSEYPPQDLLGNLIVQKDEAFGEARYLNVRGTVTLEEVLYSPPPNAIPKRIFGFSTTQQIITRYFLFSFWVAALVPAVLYVFQIIAAYVGLTLSLPN